MGSTYNGDGTDGQAQPKHDRPRLRPAEIGPTAGLLLAQRDRLFRRSGCFVWLRTFPAAFAIMLADAFRCWHSFSGSRTIAPARRGCGQLDTVCAWRVAASGG